MAKSSKRSMYPKRKNIQNDDDLYEFADEYDMLTSRPLQLQKIQNREFTRSLNKKKNTRGKTAK